MELKIHKIEMGTTAFVESELFFFFVRFGCITSL